jgi:alkanesulfonate monooxygenase SsuD/methylene tetrahydromethanopterin reductase-like flavin-dependent oxidoreductase (luciferase family)
MEFAIQTVGGTYDEFVTAAKWTESKVSQPLQSRTTTSMAGAKRPRPRPLPDAYATKVARAREAATAAGRNPDELLISSSGQVIGANTIAEFRDLVAEIAKKSDMDPEEILRKAEKRNSPMGTWDQVRAILAGLEETGLQRFYFQGKFDPDEIELKLSKLT